MGSPSASVSVRTRPVRDTVSGGRPSPSRPRGSPHATANTSEAPRAASFATWLVLMVPVLLNGFSFANPGG